MFFRAFTRLLRRDPAPPRAAELLRDLDRIETFPTLSDTAVRAMALVNDPVVTLADLADLVRRDGVLATAVLKLANSAAYGGRGTDNLHKAAVRLGLRGCHQALVTVGAREAFPRGGPTAGACEALLRHALFTATLATRLGAAGGLGFRGEEFTAGLLHDIGRVIVCARAPEAFARADPMTFREDAGVLARERAALGTDHCEIGARFAGANRLPKSVAAAIRHHHAPGAASEHPVLVALTAAADGLANHAQRERNLSAFRPDRCPAFRRLAELVGRDAVRAVRTALSASVVRALRETRALLRVAER